jgi:hypothetical protein
MLAVALAQAWAPVSLLLSTTYFKRIFHIRPLAQKPHAHPCYLGALWILRKRYQGSEHEIAAVSAAHHRCGPIVRLGPRSVSQVSVRRTLGAKLEKPSWYSPFSNCRSVSVHLPNLLLTAKIYKLHVECRCSLVCRTPMLCNSALPQTHHTEFDTAV